MKNEDPFLSLGFGLMSYRKTLYSLMILFFIMSGVTNPILETYKSGIGINANTTTSKYGIYSLGNLGYSSLQCNPVPFGMGKLVLTCPYGSISGIVPNGLGINAKGSTTMDACLVSNATDIDNKSCSDQLDKDMFMKDFDKNCVGYESCSFTLNTTNNKYVKKSGDKTLDGTCNNQRSNIFIQYKCEITELEQYEKYNQLTLVTVLTMMATFLYSLLIYWLQTTSKLDQVKYDLKTITAGDFTVEYDITAEMYETFLRDHYEPTGKNEVEESGEKYSPALYLKKYLAQRVGEVLSDSIKYKLEHDKHHTHKKNRKSKQEEKSIEERSKIHVSDIEFAYNNAKIINLLKKRGTAITYLDFKGVKQIE